MKHITVSGASVAFHITVASLPSRDMQGERGEGSCAVDILRCNLPKHIQPPESWRFEGRETKENELLATWMHQHKRRNIRNVVRWRHTRSEGDIHGLLPTLFEWPSACGWTAFRKWPYRAFQSLLRLREPASSRVDRAEVHRKPGRSRWHWSCSRICIRVLRLNLAITNLGTRNTC